MQPLPQSQNSQSSDKGKRPLPGHPCRLGSKKSKTATPESVPRTVYLLDERGFEDGEEYSLTDSARPFVPPAALRYIYDALVQPHFNYCNEVRGNCGKTLSDKLQKLTNRVARIVTFSSYDADAGCLLQRFGWKDLIAQRQIQEAFKASNSLAPDYPSSMFTECIKSGFAIRDSANK